MLCLDKLGFVLSICFLKEKYFWKLVCLICTSLLIFQLSLDYFLIKPTVSTLKKVPLSPDYIPDILICRGEGFKKRNLKEHGYNSVGKYINGYGNNGKFVGWNGLHDIDPLRKQFKHSIQQYVSF